MSAPVRELNELEFMPGEVYANSWAHQLARAGRNVRLSNERMKRCALRKRLARCARQPPL